MSTLPPSNPATPSPSPAVPAWLEVVAARARSLRFGVVQITVHDGRVTQVEVTERTRFERSVDGGPPGRG